MKQGTSNAARAQMSESEKTVESSYHVNDDISKESNEKFLLHSEKDRKHINMKNSVEGGKGKEESEFKK